MSESNIENRGEIIIYRAEDNTVQLDVRMENETVWLTQDQMAQLFGRDRTVIGRHIRNIFSEGELNESLVCAKIALPKKYGRRGGFKQEIETTLYNLDVIISVGYRVKSQRGVQFRQWANKIIKDYLVKGYAINENSAVSSCRICGNSFRLSDERYKAKRLRVQTRRRLSSMSYWITHTRLTRSTIMITSA